MYPWLSLTGLDELVIKGESQLPCVSQRKANVGHQNRFLDTPTGNRYTRGSLLETDFPGGCTPAKPAPGVDATLPLGDNRRVSKLYCANLEDGRPTANEALLRLDFELQRARACGAVVLKLIHGYGSSGVGGVLRDAIQQRLRELTSSGGIRAFVPGEDWRISNELAWKLQRTLPELKHDRDLGRGNRGISMVLL